jgi:hypothetical protein
MLSNLSLSLLLLSASCLEKFVLLVLFVVESLIFYPAAHTTNFEAIALNGAQFDLILEVC